jgi:hypothetical protein
MTKSQLLQAQADELRALGYRVHIEHIRRWRAEPVMASLFERKQGRFEPEWKMDGYGGMTVVTISKDEARVAVGIAVASDKDRYSKSTGRLKALGRAFGEFGRNEPGVMEQVTSALKERRSSRPTTNG